MSKEKTPAQAGKKGRGRGLLLGLGCAAAVLVLLGVVLYATGIVSRTVGATVKQKDVTDADLWREIAKKLKYQKVVGHSERCEYHEMLEKLFEAARQID